MCADYIFPICMFADKSVGKETFTKRNLYDITNGEENYYSERLMKIGWYSSAKTINVYNTTIRLPFRICNLEERFMFLWMSYLRNSRLIILMYDITNTESFNSLSKWFQVIRKKKANFKIPVLLVGNKLDLGEIREITKDKVKQFKENNNVSSSIEISLKTGKNCERLFTKITRIILKNRDESLAIRIEPNPI
jgi:GTPase SAR1 family protein